MKAETIAQGYLQYLQEAKLDKLLSLFADNAIVVSPVYGEMLAKDFYPTLIKDTKESFLEFDGLFEEGKGLRYALLFKYHWTLRNGKKVVFDVVDILELNSDYKITKLNIIYDTVISRELVRSLE